MKKINITLILFFILIISFTFGFSLCKIITKRKDIKFPELYEKDRIFYRTNSSVPYTGVYIKFFNYNNSKAALILNIKNGKRNGKYICYYPNGQLSEKGSFKNNKMNGKFSAYYPNGNILKIYTVKEGKLHGAFKVFSIDGEITKKFYSDMGTSIDEKAFFEKYNKKTVPAEK